MTYLKWLLMVPVSLFLTVVSFPLALILPFFAKDGWLPNWLSWFQTPDNSLYPTTSNLGLMLYNYQPATNYWGFWDMKVEKRTTATVALTASGSWVNATPTIYPGVTTAAFQSGSQAYLSGTSGTPALYASAEL